MTMTLFIQAALVVAGLSVAGFCLLLARRLRKLNDLETGLGGAIAVMAAEIARKAPWRRAWRLLRSRKPASTGRKR